MQNAPVRSVFSEITDFLATNPTPGEIIAYRLPDDLQARAHYLLELNGEGELTPEEHEEMMALLKAKTNLKLRRGKGDDVRLVVG